MRTQTYDWCRRAASCFLLATVAYLFLPTAASSQEPGDKVRVPTSYANVHMGPSSGQQILVLVPGGYRPTRDRAAGESGSKSSSTPELKKLGMKMRWYENEERGWMHETTVEIVE